MDALPVSMCVVFAVICTIKCPHCGKAFVHEVKHCVDSTIVVVPCPDCKRTTKFKVALRDVEQ